MLAELSAHSAAGVQIRTIGCNCFINSYVYIQILIYVVIILRIYIILMSSSQYLHSNPLAEHNSGIALSSKQVPAPVGGTGNMYMGQAGREFVQGGGGASQFYSSDVGNPANAHAHGSYAPVTVGSNSVTSGGGKKRSGRKVCKSVRGKKKCGKICNSKCKSRRNKRISHRRRGSRRLRQYGGSNAAYSIAGAATDVTRSTTALANPAPYTAYNSCHPVA
jgi:hypothetical protein